MPTKVRARGSRSYVGRLEASRYYPGPVNPTQNQCRRRHAEGAGLAGSVPAQPFAGAATPAAQEKPNESLLRMRRGRGWPEPASRFVATGSTSIGFAQRPPLPARAFRSQPSAGGVTRRPAELAGLDRTRLSFTPIVTPAALVCHSRPLRLFDSPSPRQIGECRTDRHRTGLALRSIRPAPWLRGSWRVDIGRIARVGSSHHPAHPRKADLPI